MSNRVFTIGHSTYPVERFVDLLKINDITAVVDVRSSPYSRMNPQFNRESLSKLLKEFNIAYVFLGKELGARSDDPSCYQGGKVQYSRIAKTDLFRHGLERVISGSKSYKIALMCAEKEPLSCHRTLLVSRQLDIIGVPIAHIHSDGHTESHDEAMTRLLHIVGLPEVDMFKSRDQLIDDACSIHEQKIAYEDEEMAKQEMESKK